MSHETTDRLRRDLVAILERDGQSAAYWKTHFTVRMSEEAGALFFNILGMENAGWTYGNNKNWLKGCQCTTSLFKNRYGIICRNFQPCPSHASVIIDLLEQAKLPSVRPAVDAPKPKQPKKLKKIGLSIIRLQNRIFGDGSGVQSLIKVRNTNKKKTLGRTCVTKGSGSDIPRNFHEKSSGLMNNVKSKDH